MNHQDLSLSGDEGHSSSQRDSVYDDAGSIHSESSMIFERNVEDPYSQVFSNPRLASLSRSASNANLAPYDSHDSLHDNGSGLSLSKSSSRKQSNAGSFIPHHTLENLVAPALDEGVTIVNDDSTDLESVEMIYSRRPSTIGLDMALGRTRTNSSSDAATLSGNNSSTTRLMRTNSASQGSGLETRPRVLRFYSYADMISDENSSYPRRPSITQSLSSTLLRQQGAGTPTGFDSHRAGNSPSNQLGSPDFSNPFLNNQAIAAAVAANGGNGGQGVSPLESHRKLSNVSIPPLAVATRHYSGNLACRSPNTNTTNGHRLSTSPLMIPHNPNSALLRKSNFQIESSGSECSDDEDPDQHRSNSNSSNSNNNRNTQHRGLDHDVSSAGTLNTPPVNPQGLRLSRTSTQGSGFNKKFSPPAYKTRAYSNASGVSPYANNFSRSSVSSANTQILDDVFCDEQLQSNTASEVVKKKLTNEI